ncbi:MAG: DHH family phosphoesterase [Cellulosilyticaceae bacterium]
MNTELIHQIIDKLESYDTIALYRHVYPDPDSYGAQVALKEIIEESFPGKKVYLMGEHDERLGYIGEMHKKEEVTLDEKSLAVILDVANAPRVDDQSFNDCGYILKIDHHHPFDEPFEALTWVDTTYPATCVMLMDLVIHSKGRLKFSKRSREALYIGMIADTGRFEYIENPTSLFERLVHITHDLDTKPLYEAYYERKVNEVQFEGYIYSNFEIRENGVAILKIPASVLEKFDMNYMVAARKANTLKGIEGLVNWHFFAEVPGTNKIMCEFRSSGPQVNGIAAKYGGGGHHLAAGATVEGWDTVEAMIKDFEVNAGAYKAAH